MGNAVGDGGIDRVFCEVTQRAEIIRGRVRCAAERPELTLHFVRRLPGPDNDFADPAHGLRVGGHHRDGTEIVQAVFGGDRLGPDARLGERNVLGDLRIEVMADHQHVQMLVDGVDSKRARRVGRRGQYVGFAADADDVGGVSAAGTFRVKRMDRPALEGPDRIVDIAGLVQRVRVDRDLHVEFVGHA